MDTASKYMSVDPEVPKNESEFTDIFGASKAIEANNFKQPKPEVKTTLAVKTPQIAKTNGVIVKQ